MSTANHRRLSGLLFILFPLLVQIPFTMLTINFSYPDVLREPAAQILTNFHAGGSGLILTWYVYALSILVFIAALAIFQRTHQKTLNSQLVGYTSAVIQLIALLRWTFLVPFLANDYVNATNDSTRESLAAFFTMQHNFLGVGLGEHIGQLTLALWTIMFIREVAQPRWLKIIGYVSAGIVLIGLSEHLGVVFGFDAGMFAEGALVGFMLWSVWMIGFGVVQLLAVRTK